MLTRRIRGRVFLLAPNKHTNQIIGYVLAAMAKKWNVKIHAVIVLSNHWHVCLSDPDGNVVNFQRDCHQFITRGLNTRYGDSESNWGNTQGSRVECEQPEDLIKQIAYTMANAVEARLVAYGKNWPGLRCAWPRKSRVFKRPTLFFRGPDKGGVWPDEAVLEMSRPPGYEELADEELADLVQIAVDTREEDFRKQYKDEKLPFLKRREILRQSRYGTPKTREEREKRLGISPKIACGDKWRRIERIAANKLWVDAYRRSLRSWRAGDHLVEFPAGTYLMRVIHGVNCARAPD